MTNVQNSPMSGHELKIVFCFKNQKLLSNNNFVFLELRNSFLYMSKQAQSHYKRTKHGSSWLNAKSFIKPNLVTKVNILIYSKLVILHNQQIQKEAHALYNVNQQTIKVYAYLKWSYLPQKYTYLYQGTLTLTNCSKSGLDKFKVRFLINNKTCTNHQTHSTLSHYT